MSKKKSKNAAKNETITLEEMNIILTIPDLSVSLKVVATVIIDGEQVEVVKSVNLSDIRKAREDFLENVAFGDDYNAEFAATEEGRKLLDNCGVTS